MLHHIVPMGEVMCRGGVACAASPPPAGEATHTAMPQASCASVLQPAAPHHDHAKGECVGRGCCRAARQHLGRQPPRVEHAAAHGAGVAPGRVQQRRKVEVAELHGRVE